MKIITQKETVKEFSTVHVDIPYFRIERVTNYGYDYSVSSYDGWVTTFIVSQTDRKFLFWKLKDKVKIKQIILQGKQTDGEDSWIAQMNFEIKRIAEIEKNKAKNSIEK